jgi:hypothetical protein
MSPQLVLCNPEETLPEDGILFVRIKSTLTTMAKIPIIIIGLVMIVIAIPINNSLGAIRTLDFIIYQDGSTHVFYQTEVDPLSPDFTLQLFGETIDNFVAQDENGFLLSSEIQGNRAIIETFGASLISIDYDTHDLVTKSGKIWSFNIKSPTDYTVSIPKNTVIVGMSVIPLNMEILGEQSRIFLPGGPAEISYFFGLSGSAQIASIAIDDARSSIEQIKNSGIMTSLADAKLLDALSAYNEGKYTDATELANEAHNIAIQEQKATELTSNTILDNSMILVAGAVVAGGIASAIIVKRRKSIKNESLEVKETQKEVYKPVDKETIFKIRPNLREDDKELVNFIFDNGGQAYESELRKKFLQPRTTMWRAVKRLEREGIVEIEKKELQNLVKLKTRIKEDQK